MYKAFGGKAALVKSVFEVAIAGDDGPLTVLERESLNRVRREAGLYAKLELYGQFVADTAPRHAPIQLLIRAAAAADDEAAQVWDQLIEQAKGMLSRTHHIDVDAAFERMRAYSRRNHHPLSDVARAVVTDPGLHPELTTAS